MYPEHGSRSVADHGILKKSFGSKEGAKGKLPFKVTKPGQDTTDR